ncbi:MAG: alpha/beta fold hydrolase [Candidatus Kerfeldbacteria bacterium]|nr:alpha/beta fold hydrolase [Candidatus Kerfeldbacteria bacterium]
MPEPYSIHPNAMPFTFDGGTGRVAILVHGFTGTPAYVRPLGAFLATHGIGSVGVRLPGHGTRPADLRTTTRFHWRQAIDAAYDRTVARDPSPVLVGFSLGGMLLADLLIRRGVPASGLVLVNTPVRTHDHPLLVRLLPLLSRVKPYVRKRWARNPSLNAWYAAHGAYPVLPLRSSVQFFALIHEAAARLDAIRVPVLIVQSRQDPVVDPVSADLLTRGLRHAASVERMDMDGAVHHVLNDEQDGHRAIYERIRAFIAAQPKPLSPGRG